MKLAIGIFLFIVSGLIHFIYWNIQEQILKGEIDSIGFKGVPIIIAIVGLPLLSAYLIIGYGNPVIFACYFFGFLLIASGGSFLIKSIWKFWAEPVLISRPKGGGKVRTFLYTIIQLILVGILLYIIMISSKMIFGR